MEDDRNYRLSVLVPGSSAWCNLEGGENTKATGSADGSELMDTKLSSYCPRETVLLRNHIRLAEVAVGMRVGHPNAGSHNRFKAR